MPVIIIQKTPEGFSCGSPEDSLSHELRRGSTPIVHRWTTTTFVEMVLKIASECPRHRIEFEGKFFRVRRGKVVEIPHQWVGKVTSRQTINARSSKLTGKARREEKRWHRPELSTEELRKEAQPDPES